MVPTGVIESVDETPLDFRTATKIGDRIEESHFMLVGGGGYDLNYCLTSKPMELAAKAWCEKTGIALEVFTTEPGVQLYTGNFLAGVKGKSGVTHNKRDGFCLETQHYPDSAIARIFHRPSITLVIHSTPRRSSNFQEHRKLIFYHRKGH